MRTARGIVHRDLKPGNVMLTQCGREAARLRPRQGGAARRPIGPVGSDACPRRTQLTAEGTLVGTLQYMAPEQLEGKDADARTDIFAFGALLYEMATGGKAFEGESQASLIAAILNGAAAADLRDARRRSRAAARARSPRRALSCEEPRRRWQTARDVKLELEWMAKARRNDRRDAASRAAHVAGRHGAGVAVAAVASCRGGTRRAPSGDASPAETFAVHDRAAGRDRSSALAADRGRVRGVPGRSPAGVRGVDRRAAAIWVRSLDSVDARPLEGTDGAVSPFWSPDSRFVGFFRRTRGELRKVDAAADRLARFAPRMRRPVHLGPRRHDPVLAVGATGSSACPAMAARPCASRTWTSRGGSESLLAGVSCRTAGTSCTWRRHSTRMASA